MSVLSSIAEIIGRPAGMHLDDWTPLAANLERGLGRVQQLIHDERAMGQVPYEWGGTALPGRLSDVATTHDPYSVMIPGRSLFLSDLKNAIQFHSHPHDWVDPQSGLQAPWGLSVPDLWSVVNDRGSVRGLTSVESEGGLGWAVRPAAKDRRRFHSAKDDIWQAMEEEAQRAAEAVAPHPGEVNFQIPGHGAWMRGEKPLGATGATGYAADPVADTISNGRVASRFGLGSALKDAGLLESFGYRPGTTAQANAFSALRPAMFAARDAAQEVIRKAIERGDIRAILAMLGGTGMAAALAGAHPQEGA